MPTFRVPAALGPTFDIVEYYIVYLRRYEAAMSTHRTQRLISSLGIALVALTLAGIIYEQIGRRRDRTRYPQIGQSIDIGEGTLNIFCSGQGSPTVVLDRGGHTAGYTWISIQPEISKLTLPLRAPPGISRMNCTCRR